MFVLHDWPPAGIGTTHDLNLAPRQPVTSRATASQRR